MKSKLLHAASAVCFGVLLCSGAVSAFADDISAAKPKTASGTITAIEPKDKVLKLRGYLLSKTFVLGDDCPLTLAGRKASSLADFQPGQQVDVMFKDVDGVLVATQVNEQRLTYAGKVTALDPAGRSLTVLSGGNSRSFKLPDYCNVILADDKKGVLDDVKPGDHVTVIYETPYGQWTATRIEQPSLQFTGSLDAINASGRTISAGKKLIGDKQFHLANDCAIFNNGKMDGRLQDLKVGQNYELSYTTVDGVNIVSRIAPAPAAAPAGNNTSANLNQTIPAY